MADAPDYDEVETRDLEPASAPGKPPLGGLRRRGIYLLPNLFTTGVLFCGFFAIVQAMNGRFETSAIAIFVGSVTMVSNVPFWSFKEVNWKKRVPLWMILACVIGLSVIASSPSLVLFLLFFGYALSGYVMWAMGHRVRPVLPEE